MLIFFCIAFKVSFRKIATFGRVLVAIHPLWVAQYFDDATWSLRFSLVFFLPFCSRWICPVIFSQFLIDCCSDECDAEACACDIYAKLSHSLYVNRKISLHFPHINTVESRWVIIDFIIRIKFPLCNKIN